MLIAPARAAPYTWDGGGGNNNASTPANWVGDAAPSAGDDIILDATTNKDMTWDAAAPSSVASWTQVGYTGAVTFATVYGASGFTNFEITGNCVVSNGTWTHPANAGAEVSRLRVAVGGTFEIGPAGRIDVTGRGYGSSSGPGKGVGAL